MTARSRWWLPGLLGLAMLLAPAPAAAQIPDEFTNLQLIPKDIDQRELVMMMREFAGALGMRCWGCHVGEEGPSLAGFDFASDDKKEKRVAREMMKMVDGINKTVEGIDTGHAGRITVTCATCHHGLEKPESLKDVLARVYEADGVDGALSRYQELREEYYGGSQYDFGVGPLNMMAERIGRGGDTEDALKVQELNAELHPDDSFVHASLGMMYAQSGEKEKGIAALQRAIEIDPENRWAKQQLDRLKK